MKGLAWARYLETHPEEYRRRCLAERKHPLRWKPPVVRMVKLAGRVR